MPTFYTHIFNGTGPEIDEAGTTYPNADAAIAEAAKMAGELLEDEVRSGSADLRAQVVIENAARHRIARISIELSRLSPGEADGLDRA